MLLNSPPGAARAGLALSHGKDLLNTRDVVVQTREGTSGLVVGLVLDRVLGHSFSTGLSRVLQYREP